MTRRLWHALTHPPLHHPLHQRVVQSARPRRAVRWALWLALSGAAMLLLIAGLLCFPLTVGTGFLAIMIVVPLALTVYLALDGTFSGLRCTWRASHTLAQLQRGGALDLVALSPHGGLEALWAACTGCLHQRDALTRAQSGRWTLLYVTLVPVVALTVGLSMERHVPVVGQIEMGLQGHPSLLLVYAALSTATLWAALHTDYAQSLGLALLCAPLTARGRHAGLHAPLLFVGLQVGSYLLVALVGWVLLPALAPAGTAGPWWQAGVVLHDATLPLLRLAAFVLLRDALLHALWALCARAYHATPAECAALLPPPPRRAHGRASWGALGQERAV